MKKDKFFLAMGVIMAGVVLVGFTPSFILRPWFRETPLPFIFLVHGLFMLAWYAAFVHQAYLAAAARLLNHRRNGRIWLVLAAGIVLSSLGVFWQLIGDYRLGERTLEGTSMLIIGNTVLLATIIAFLTVGYSFRNRPAIHKRAMYAASVTMLVPAFDRFGRLLGMEQLVAVFLTPVLFYGPLIAYDVVKDRWPHLISVLALVWGYVHMIFGLFLIRSGAGEAIVQWLQ